MFNTTDNLMSELLESLKQTNSSTDASSAFEWAQAVIRCYDVDVSLDADNLMSRALANAHIAYTSDDPNYMSAIQLAAELLDNRIV